MHFAQLVALRSHHPTFKVGAVVIDSKNTRVLSIGYNGDFCSGPNSLSNPIPGESQLIHAEENALLKLDYHEPGGRILYLTLSPCLMCAKLILNARIDKVVYLENYRDSRGIELLAKHIEVERIKIGNTRGIPAY